MKHTGGRSLPAWDVLLTLNLFPQLPHPIRVEKEVVGSRLPRGGVEGTKQRDRALWYEISSD